MEWSGLERSGVQSHISKAEQMRLMLGQHSAEDVCLYLLLLRSE